MEWDQLTMVLDHPAIWGLTMVWDHITIWGLTMVWDQATVRVQTMACDQPVALDKTTVLDQTVVLDQTWDLMDLPIGMMIKTRVADSQKDLQLQIGRYNIGSLFFQKKNPVMDIILHRRKHQTKKW